MAELLASIYGTEKDKVNCSFYYKIGACRHGTWSCLPILTFKGDKCARKHVKPPFSQTVLLCNLYQNPQLDPACSMTQQELQQHFDQLYEDIFIGLSLKYGEIEEMNVCDNVGDHLIGNIYCRFKYTLFVLKSNLQRYEEDAGKAMLDLCTRFYGGRPIYAELSPVTDFREACCRQYETDECSRGSVFHFQIVYKLYPC